MCKNKWRRISKVPDGRGNSETRPWRYGIAASFPLPFHGDFLLWHLPVPESTKQMRIRMQVGLFGAGTVACASFFCLSTTTDGSQTNAPPNGVEPSSVEKGWRSPEVLLTPQQLQEQHQQLLKAVDLIRQETQVHLQRYATAVDRIRKDTDASLKRFTATVDGKLDRLNRAIASERERDLQTMRNSNRFALTTASIIVGLLLLEILFLAWISGRAVNRLATRMSGWISEQSSFSGAAAGVGSDAAHSFTGNRVEETSLRLRNAIKRLEQRLLDFEHTTSRFQTTLTTSPVTQVSIASTAHLPSNPPPSKPGKASGVSLALGQGESLIFLPHEGGTTPLSSYRNFLHKLRKRFQPARMTKSP